MDKQEFENALLGRLRQQPFQPFFIELSDGERLVVGHPRTLSYLCGPSAIYFDPDGHGMMFHSEAVRRIVELVPAST